MSTGPFPLQPVIDRLAAQVPLAVSVGTAADLDTALANPPRRAPAIYVLREERGGASKYSGPMAVQNCDVTVKVVLFARNSREERLGLGARELADELIAQVRKALIGWTPDDAFNGLTFRGGRDDRFTAGWIAIQEHFATDYRIRNQVTP